jgi:hypothetical protein
MKTEFALPRCHARTALDFLFMAIVLGILAAPVPTHAVGLHIEPAPTCVASSA